MYRLKPTLTFRTWGFVVGFFLIAFGMPGLLRTPSDREEVRVDMVEFSGISVGYPCVSEEQGFLNVYDCEDGSIATYQQVGVKDPVHTLERMRNVFFLTEAGRVKEVTDLANPETNEVVEFLNGRVWELPVEEGVIIGLDNTPPGKDDGLMAVVWVTGENYKQHAAGVLGAIAEQGQEVIESGVVMDLGLGFDFGTGLGEDTHHDHDDERGRV